MSTSIIPQLVRKDLRLARGAILTFGLVSLAAMLLVPLLHGHIPDWALINLGFILLVGPAATCGIVLAMKTNVFEREKSTQAFIMSLPVTMREYTHAKLLVNLPVFVVFWLAVSAVAFYLAFGLGLFPPGAAPFITMVFLGVLVAYCCILSASLVFQSLGATVLAILLFELATSAYLWTVAYSEPIARHVYGATATWNATALSIVAVQVVVAVAVIAATVHIQGAKRDCI
ncbi:ABC-2 transporter permease [Duganella sp. BuS-21]|uniref:ABC-2 transporter permease n=1 Tax=Duganella sp. BuS-21 TaxID=2943848 RepID=UPI0035A6F5C3